MADLDLREWGRRIAAGEIPSVEEMMTVLHRQGGASQQVRDATIRTLVNCGRTLEEVIPQVIDFEVERQVRTKSGQTIFLDLCGENDFTEYIVRVYGFVDYMHKVLPENRLTLPHVEKDSADVALRFHFRKSMDRVSYLLDNRVVFHSRSSKEFDEIRRPGLELPEVEGGVPQFRNVTPQLLYASILNPE